MDNSFLAYLQRLEMMAFFSGYPLIYSLILFVAGNKQSKNNSRSSLVSFLPFSYALVGTLYLCLQLKNLYPDYFIGNIKLTVQLPYLKIWGLFSILFWLPALGRKTVLSLVHSFVFFFFFVKDLFFQLSGLSADKNIVRNDMKIYTVSLLLNLAAFALIILIFFLFTRSRKLLRS